MLSGLPCRNTNRVPRRLRSGIALLHARVKGSSRSATTERWFAQRTCSDTDVDELTQVLQRRTTSFVAPWSNRPSGRPPRHVCSGSMCCQRQVTIAVPKIHLYMASISSFSRWEMTTTTLPPSMRYAWHTCKASRCYCQSCFFSVPMCNAFSSGLLSNSDFFVSIQSTAHQDHGLARAGSCVAVTRHHA